MLSAKKRFKNTLKAIEQTALALELLSMDMPLIQELAALVSRILLLSRTLTVRATELSKAEFVELIRQDNALLELDDLANEDVISVLEERLSAVIGDCAEGGISEFVGQFLEKLEKQHAKLIKEIRELGVIIAESD